jgi:hypothetical protein
VGSQFPGKSPSHQNEVVIIHEAVSAKAEASPTRTPLFPDGLWMRAPRVPRGFSAPSSEKCCWAGHPPSEETSRSCVADSPFLTTGRVTKACGEPVQKVSRCLGIGSRMGNPSDPTPQVKHLFKTATQITRRFPPHVFGSRQRMKTRQYLP